MNTESSKSAPRLVLGSSSQYRKSQLSDRLGLVVECIAPDIDESELEGESPLETAQRLSREKAWSVANRLENNTIVIAGDQTAAFGEELLRKPMSRGNAINQLSRFRGKKVVFYSGVCVVDCQTGTHQEAVTETRVQFRQLTDEQIERYIDKDMPLDCVGSFKNEHLGIALFESIESEDPSALTGLPLIKLNLMLAKLNIDLLLL